MPLTQFRQDRDDDFLQALIATRRHAPRIRERMLLVGVVITVSEVCFTIRDQGRGFGAMLTGGDETAEQFGAGQWRSRTLIHSLMHEIAYNETPHELVMSICIGQAIASQAGA